MIGILAIVIKLRAQTTISLSYSPTCCFVSAFMTSRVVLLRARSRPRNLWRNSNDAAAHLQSGCRRRVSDDDEDSLARTTTSARESAPKFLFKKLWLVFNDNNPDYDASRFVARNGQFDLTIVSLSLSSAPRGVIIKQFACRRCSSAHRNQIRGALCSRRTTSVGHTSIDDTSVVVVDGPLKTILGSYRLVSLFCSCGRAAARPRLSSSFVVSNPTIVDTTNLVVVLVVWHLLS